MVEEQGMDWLDWLNVAVVLGVTLLYVLNIFIIYIIVDWVMEALKQVFENKEK